MVAKKLLSEAEADQAKAKGSVPVQHSRDSRSKKAEGPTVILGVSNTVSNPVFNPGCFQHSFKKLWLRVNSFAREVEGKVS